MRTPQQRAEWEGASFQILNLIISFYFVNQSFTGEQKQEESSQGKYNLSVDLVSIAEAVDCWCC